MDACYLTTFVQSTTCTMKTDFTMDACYLTTFEQSTTCTMKTDFTFIFYSKSFKTSDAVCGTVLYNQRGAGAKHVSSQEQNYSCHFIFNRSTLIRTRFSQFQGSTLNAIPM